MKTINRISILLILLFASVHTFSQSWQWGKRGGSTDDMPTNAGGRREEVSSIVTDSNKNIYILSTMGVNFPDVDGHPKTNYGDDNTKTDYLLSSFACDGSYRWSKVFGGGGREDIHNLQIDSNNNIYVAGKFANCNVDFYPPRIEDDLILEVSDENCSMIFISKFNSDGIMQWFKRPQPIGTTFAMGFSNTTSRGLTIDNLGNSYWLVSLPVGTYADGAFNCSTSGYYVLKYDSAGNYVNATFLDMQLGTTALYIQFYRNPNNGHFFVMSNKSDANLVVTIGGESITQAFYMASFDNNGNFLWKREATSNSSSQTISAYNLVFDTDNSIYLGGQISSNNVSFAGYAPVTGGSPSFIMKLNPTADNYIWATNDNVSGSNYGGLAMNGNEIGYTGFGYDTVVWGNQTLNVNINGQATDVLFARFNKTTGACLGLSKIVGDAGWDDRGTALAVDVSGDYILGGAMGNQLYINGTTLQSNVGGQTDFFVAKYSTSLCSPLGVGEVLFPKKESPLVVAPNPSKSQTTVFYNYVEGKSNKIIIVLDILGRTLNSYIVKENKGNFVLNTSGNANGTYFVWMKENGKIIERTKLVIKN